ncbi:MAG: LamG-like jellyroll fold domain-containing protein [Pirellulaceae bacterium]
MKSRLLPSCLWMTVLTICCARADEPELIAHWPLQNDSRATVGSTGKQIEQGIKYGPVESPGDKPGPRRAASFNGRDAVLMIDAQAIRLGTDDFSLAAWIESPVASDDVPGDIISQYDPATRTGFHLGLYTHGGVTTGQPNVRQLHFGIDQGRLEAEFTDHGRLGNAVFVFALCVHDGRLYAATCHTGSDEAGHVFRFEGGDAWTDLGSPDRANSISAMAAYQGELYVASSKYRLAGSALSESTNPHLGGRVFRLGADGQWIPCGQLSPETEAIGSLVVYRGALYASSLYRPAGFFRYEGGERWTALPTPDGKRVESLTVYNGDVFATSYDEGSVFRFDGERWAAAGTVPEATQTYGFGIHGGELYVSEWPKARVFRYGGGTQWTDVGKLGQELEAMPLLVYNGKLYGGTLPQAEVYRFDGDHQWSRVGRVDHTPDVKYRRAWSMAVFQGRLFVGTLPSGRVRSIEAGRNATLDRELPAGWHHVVAVRGSDQLQLYVDGAAVAQSARFTSGDYDLTNRQPLDIGFGAQDHFHGRMADVRIYRGALTANAVRELYRDTARP